MQKHYILSINPMALSQQTPLVTINNDEDDDQRFTDQQLLNRTARYLSILEQGVEDQYRNINPHQIELLSARRQMQEILRMILNKSHQLVCSGSALGFVFGLITENKIWTASSDNLRSWWKEDVDFEQNGPRALLSLNVSETLQLESLKDLQDATLSSITSALIQKCMPSQRSCPFHLGKPVEWWPTGTEEWWSQLNFPKDLGPPEYKKPHDLKKQWKVAVLVAVIKNIEPDFQKIRRLVCESRTVQNKMTHKENSIWLAVLGGEEMVMKHKQQLYDREYGPSNVDVMALGNSGSGSSVGGIVDKESEACLVPSSLRMVESSDVAHEEMEALPSSPMRDESSEANKFKRIAINVEPEMVPMRSPTFTQGPILETSCPATSKADSSRRQKLKGITITEPGMLKLPNYQNNSCWGGSNFSRSPMSTNHQFRHQSQTNNMLHPSAMNYRLSSSSLQPSLTAFSTPCADPGCFGIPTLLCSNNSPVTSSNFGGQVPKNNQVTSSNFGGQLSNNHMNFEVSGQISSSNQENSSNFVGPISNNNPVKFSNYGRMIPSINQVNFSNFDRRMSSNNQANSSYFGGQISNYMNATTDAMNVSHLTMASTPESSNFVLPRNDQVFTAEGQSMPRSSAVNSMVQNLDLESMDFECAPFADSNFSLDFNVGLDSFTGGGGCEDDASDNWNMKMAKPQSNSMIVALIQYVK